MKSWSIQNRTLDLSSPVIVGILNVTPDSFSDGGTHQDVEAAALSALEMESEGAGIIDIGGESTRPGATPVDVREELLRILPVVEAIRRFSNVPISIDTRHAIVADAALNAGANIINDVSSLADDKMAEVVRSHNAGLVLMHGFTEHINPPRESPPESTLVDRIRQYLDERATFAEAMGIQRERIALDPGFGFGKNTSENLTLLRDLAQLKTLNLPLFIGLSRKRFIGEITHIQDPCERDVGSIVASLHAIAQGADLVRVHAVASMQSAILTSSALSFP